MYLSIIIVNFNVFGHLVNCIKSIKDKLNIPDYEIIVVDNNSTETLINNLTDLFQDVKLIKLKTNLGFAQANNLAASQLDSKYICFINPDTILIEDCISPIIYFMEVTLNVGICSPALVFEDLKYQNSSGFKMGIWYEFLEAFMFIGIFRHIQKYRYVNKSYQKKPISIDWLSGACMIVKKSVFVEIGGFSEDYFLNYEDIDLCRKIQYGGYNNFYFPYLKLIHLDHRSFANNYELLVYTRYKSRKIYAKKHYSKVSRYLVSIIHIIGLLLRLLTVFLFYSGVERKQRYEGYRQSLKIYLRN